VDTYVIRTGKLVGVLSVIYQNLSTSFGIAVDFTFELYRCKCTEKQNAEN